MRLTIASGERRELICPSCQLVADIFACDVGQITGRFPRVFCPPEGRFAIVTKRGAGDAVDAADARDECVCHGRRSRGVLIPRRWYQAGSNAFASWPVTEATSPALRGDHEGNR